jgi:hypothetical protein
MPFVTSYDKDMVPFSSTHKVAELVHVAHESLHWSGIAFCRYSFKLVACVVPTNNMPIVKKQRLNLISKNVLYYVDYADYADK